ncbi:MAG: single-stranded DNA-binding protein [Endomicrobium sp.]|jgi:single-strand DNA-binding protein|nr:single-stranded DNA-binding protein [Endomicrobium sp.]
MSEEERKLRLPEQNIVIITGRLTRDAELRRTSKGTAVCKFDIAMGRRVKEVDSGEWKEEVTYVPIIVWGEQGERCGERLKKGSPVQIEGRLHMNKWTGQDGVKRSRLEVICLRVQFLAVLKAEKEEWNNVVGNDVEEAVEDEKEDIPF